MAETPKSIIVNKHRSEKSAITESLFTGPGDYKLGELVICNDKNDPGIYILVRDGANDTPINVTSAEHIKLAGYVKPDGAGSYELSQDDTVSEAFGKVVKLIEQSGGQSMPNTGDALSVDNEALNVRFDNYTIKLNSDNKLYVDTTVVGGGGGEGGIIYTPGRYIAISGSEISVTGITPDAYATKAELAGYATTAELQTYATKSELEGLATASDVAAGVQEAKDYVDGQEFATTGFVETYVAEHGGGGGGDPTALNNEIARATSAETALGNRIDQLAETVNDNATATTETLEAIDGRVGANESAISELQQTVSGLDPSSMTLIGTNVITETQPFEVDGVEYEAGTYLVMTFGVEGDETTYRTSYSNISPIISAGKEYLTEAQYATLVEEGEVEVDGRTIIFDPNVDYYTFEDEEPEPEEPEV